MLLNREAPGENPPDPNRDEPTEDPVEPNREPATEPPRADDDPADDPKEREAPDDPPEKPPLVEAPFDEPNERKPPGLPALRVDALRFVMPPGRPNECH
jgi:hypothetical protein